MVLFPVLFSILIYVGWQVDWIRKFPTSNVGSSCKSHDVVTDRHMILKLIQFDIYYVKYSSTSIEDSIYYT